MYGSEQSSSGSMRVKFGEGMLFVIIWMEVLPGAVKLALREGVAEWRRRERKEMRRMGVSRRGGRIVVRQLSL